MSCVPGLRVLLVDQWIETGGTMMAAIKLVERQGSHVVGKNKWASPETPPSIPTNNRRAQLWLAFLSAGVAAIAMEKSEGGKWIMENYKCSHCVPKNLQSQMDTLSLESFKNLID